MCETPFWFLFKPTQKRVPSGKKKTHTQIIRVLISGALWGKSFPWDTVRTCSWNRFDPSAPPLNAHKGASFFFLFQGPLRPQTRGWFSFCFFPEALRRVLLLKAAANFTCQLLMPTCRELLHLPTSHANLSRVTSPANFSCQLVESYFTCQLLMPTCRELLHLPTSHANLSRVTSPANFSCQLVESYFTCQLLMPTCRELLHVPTSHVNLSRVTSPAYFSCQLFESYFTCQLLMSTFRLLFHSTKSTS